MQHTWHIISGIPLMLIQATQNQGGKNLYHDPRTSSNVSRRAGSHTQSFLLNPRQSNVLGAAVNLTGAIPGHTCTYGQVAAYLHQNTRYCRGIGQSCAAIWRRGYTPISDMVVKQ